MRDVILFLCPHNVAKSLIAASYFNRRARQLGLPMKADSAGTEPEKAVPPTVVDRLRCEGIDVSQHQPRRVSAEELETATRVIAVGCSAEALGISSDRIEQWHDVPTFSQDPDGTLEAIRVHVDQLIGSYQSEWLRKDVSHEMDNS